MMDLGTGARAANARLQDFLKTELGNRFPFMSADAVGKLAAECGLLLEGGIVKQWVLLSLISPSILAS